MLFFATAFHGDIVVLDCLVFVLEIERFFKALAVVIPHFLKAFFRVCAGNAEHKSTKKRSACDKLFHETSF
jgi:hypothetical protein